MRSSRDRSAARQLGAADPDAPLSVSDPGRATDDSEVHCREPMDTPRRGLWGIWDRVVGPGATWVENTGTVVIAVLAGLLAPTLLPAEASGLQRVAAMLFAFDLMAGIWVTATPAGRRWYQRPSRSWASRVGFVVAHVHPFVVAWVFPGSMTWACMLYGFAVLVTLLLNAIDARWRTSTCLVAIAVFLGVEAHWGPLPLEWFGVAYLLKLLAGYGLPEIPGERTARAG